MYGYSYVIAAELEGLASLFALMASLLSEAGTL